MNPLPSKFHSIRQAATRNCLNVLTKVDEIRHPLAGELEFLWNAVESFLESGGRESLGPVLEKWSASIPETSALQAEPTLSSTINLIFNELWKTIHAEMNAEDASALFLALFPLVTYAHEIVMSLEIQRATEALKIILHETQSDLAIIERNKSKFIRIAAHELKTPLTIINGYASMLDEMLKDDQTQMKEMVKGIESGAERLRGIVQDLIDVSLIDNRLLNFAIQPVWLDRLLETLQWEIAATIEKRSQTFAIDPFDGIGEMFYSDPERLMQVIRNLVSNAIKYTPDGGVISIGGRKLPGFIEVIISDTGVGIAPENQALIFEKFIQLGESSRHSSSKTSYMGGGPGLGLHITKGIIEAMGGTIWAESPGFDAQNYPGSSFHVLLPMNQKSSQENVHTFLQQ